MVLSTFHNIEITGLSCCMPKHKKKTIDYAEKFKKENVEKFIKMTGIEETHVSVEGQTASDLAYEAAHYLIEEKGVNIEGVGALLFVTETPDYLVPSTAFVLQKRLGLGTGCICFDINLGCSGFVIGLQVLASIMHSSNIEKGLLLFGDTMTKRVSPEDRSICMMLGDAGGALLLEKKEQVGSIVTAVKSDGDKYGLVMIPAGGSRNPNMPVDRVLAEDGNIRGPYDFYMDGANIFFFSTSDVVKLVKEYLAFTNKGVEDFDALVLHQANELIIKNFAKRSKFPLDKVPISIHKYGNTVGASIPVTLVDKYAGAGEETKKFLMCGFGVGLSWGLVDTMIYQPNILPMIYSDNCYTEGKL